MTQPARFPLRETLPIEKPRGEVDNWWARNSAFDRIDGMGRRLVPPGGDIASQEARQSVLLLSGDHIGFEAKCALWRVTGAPGATIRNRVVVTSGVVIFDGVTFAASDGQANTAACVEVSSGGTAVFNNCTFFRDTRNAGDIASIASGGRAHFNGCVMEPANTSTTFAVDNAGALLNVYVQANVNLTGALHNNVTIISETT